MISNSQVFNSISEMIRDLDNSTPFPNRAKKSEENLGSDWCDTENYAEARECMLHGKNFDNLSLDVEKYKTKGTGIKTVNKLSVAGYQVVVPLYLQGVPNNMITQKHKINNKVITLFYSFQAPHYVTKQELENGAEKLFRNIMSLEEQGYRVNLYLVEAQIQNGRRYGTALKLKSDREVFNIKKMLFPLLSSSFLRRIVFRIKENLYSDWIGDGYGSGEFNYKTTDDFIKTHLKIKNYEIWNYQGKQEH